MPQLRLLSSDSMALKRMRGAASPQSWAAPHARNDPSREFCRTIPWSPSLIQYPGEVDEACYGRREVDSRDSILAPATGTVSCAPGLTATSKPVSVIPCVSCPPVRLSSRPLIAPARCGSFDFVIRCGCCLPISQRVPGHHRQGHLQLRVRLRNQRVPGGAVRVQSPQGGGAPVDDACPVLGTPPLESGRRDVCNGALSLTSTGVREGSTALPRRSSSPLLLRELATIPGAGAGFRGQVPLPPRGGASKAFSSRED